MIMKSIVLLVIFFIGLCLPGCGNSAPSVYVNIDHSKDNIPGEENETFDSNRINNSQGEPAIKQRTTYKNNAGYTVEDYDRQGFLLKKSEFEMDGTLISVTDYKYDANENLISEVKIGADGIFQSGAYKKYDSNGKLVEEREKWDSEDLTTYLTTYEYDGRGLIHKKIHYDLDSETEIFEYSTYEYDQKDNLVRQLLYAPDDVLIRTYIYEYDDAGTMRKQTDSSYGNDRIYEYDEQGNKVKETYVHDGEVKTVFETVYNEKGSEADYRYDGEGNLKNHTWTKVNSSGNPVASYREDENGKKVKTCYWKYDKDGHVVEMESETNKIYAEYNKYGELIMLHEICNDMTRNAGTYDDTYRYEYVYYDDEE